MTSPAVSFEEVRNLLGEIDEIAVERIVETGATIDEVAEALGYFEADAAGDPLELPASARVLAVEAILQDVAREDDVDVFILPDDQAPSGR